MTDCGAEHPESAAQQHDHARRADVHGHGVTARADSRYIAIALCLIAGFLVFEVVMAFAGHSLALLADAGHMLTDAAAVGASLLAIRLARRPSTGAWTFGLKRAEVLSAQANGITLLVVSALVAFESVTRLIHPVPVIGDIVVTVAAVGVAVNVAATWVMAKANRDSVNVRGAFAHVITDLYGFIGTLAAGIVIILTGFDRADAIASLIVVGLMLHAAWGLLRQTGRILLEAAPEGYEPADIITAITGQPGVCSAHDVHVWLITSGFPALSAHVLVRRPANCHQVRGELEQMLCARFGLDHTTLQVDHAPDELLTMGGGRP
ncbi:MAG: cation diffusion facilitator family transporter [Actinomycetota bacterium]|nr:cation diffusion facilitator family transporter [Actinomycetota bacterium]